MPLRFDMATPRCELSLDEIHLSGLELWRGDHAVREGAFKTLRDERPISWHHEIERPRIPAGAGYWALTRYSDVREVNRDSETFISGKGTNITDIPEQFLEFFGSMINMDAPRHTKLRQVVSRAFTPRRIRALDDYVADKAAEVVSRIAHRGECDFVADVAAPIPLEIICEMMGIPAQHWTRVLQLTNIILSGGDPDYVSSVDDLLQASLELAQIARDSGLARQRDPGDDLVSALVTANVDGDYLTPEEFASFFILLVAAGNETTRTAASHGMLAFTQYPEQRRLLLEDLDGRMAGAVEEVVRWATPVINFRRTASRDVVVGGQEIKQGDKVVLWYNSANRDERQFADPYRFDILRAPNDHLGFGGGGAHFCLGANLARRELSMIFREVFTRLPDLEVTQEPALLRSNFVHGIKRMPCTFTPRP